MRKAFGKRSLWVGKGKRENFRIFSGKTNFKGIKRANYLFGRTSGSRKHPLHVPLQGHWIESLFVCLWGSS